MLRSHSCGELTAAHVGQAVTLCGWVHTTRNQGGVVFLVLRDRYGKTQVTISPDSPAALETAATLRNEFVVKVSGKVAKRPEGQIKKEQSTGEIELLCSELVILNSCDVLPFQVTDFDLPNEELRLKHRYLDLRREQMQETMMLRSRMTKIIRDYCDENNFIDVETPILGRSTPEGARDYLVPSRVIPNHFFALPQSPQLYKQILMIAGYDRYMQIARCFRDEDLRAERQPEFTQLDLEMSFIDESDIMGMVDGLVARLAKEILGIELTLPLPKMSYDEAMRRFGHDAPDLRFGMELVDISEIAAKVGFKVFSGVVASGGKVQGICAVGAASKYSRKKIDELTSYVQEDFGVKGLAWMKVEESGELKSPITKNFTAEELAAIGKQFDAKPGDLILFIADQYDKTCKALNGLRNRLGAELELYDPKTMHFSWVVNFPMFAKVEDECEGEGGDVPTGEGSAWTAKHHPFTAPLDEDLEFLHSDPEKCRAKAYDLIINGFEAGGGTIRIHDQQLQSEVFSLLGIDEQTASDRFGFLLEALRFGAPPHGGIALGVDRLIMLFSGWSNIREVIAFPKTQRSTDLMTGAPGDVDARQLQELRIATTKD